MRRVIALILCFALLFTGCSTSNLKENYNSETNASSENTDNTESEELSIPFSGLNDEALLSYVEDLVYSETVQNLNSEEYVVEEVRAIYISEEYLEEVAFNSQANMYFGYTLEELDEYFQGSRYIFTLGDNGETIAQELQEIVDADKETIYKNMAIGTGIILVCVTVSIVTAGAGAPAAVTAIFTASAKTATVFALSSGTFGAVSAGLVRGYQTGDINEALEAATLSGSEGFKWGAITGAVSGAGKEAFLLKAGTKNNLTMSEVAIIQKDSKLPIDVIAQIHSLDEYYVYKQAGLKTVMVNGRTALVQNIDLNFVSELSDGTKVTNLVRMQKGYAPIDPVTGKAYQLHHIGQKADGTLAVLTEGQHKDNAAILNIFGKESEINRTEFAKVRKEFWRYLGSEVFVNGGI